MDKHTERKQELHPHRSCYTFLYVCHDFLIQNVSKCFRSRVIFIIQQYSDEKQIMMAFYIYLRGWSFHVKYFNYASRYQTERACNGIIFMKIFFMYLSRQFLAN